LLHILILVFIYASLSIIIIQRCIVSCNCYYLLIAIRWRLGSTSHLISSLRWHPSNTYLLHYISCSLMLTIMLPLVALFSGAKTLGWDTQKFGKCFENLGKVLTLPKCKSWKRKFKGFWKISWYGWKGVLLEKQHMVLGIRPEQLNRATTLPRNGTGLSPEFICLSMGYLTTL
jgi:hypothetical protein